MLKQKNGQDISEKMKQTGNKQILSDKKKILSDTKKEKKDSSNVPRPAVVSVVTLIVFV
jgi:hypothetical protein